MGRKILFQGVVALSLAWAAACDPEQGIPDGGTCADLTYANFGKALLDSKCVGCHSVANASGGVTLDTLADVQANADGIVLHAVDRFPPAMPYNQPALPQADLDKLQQWVNCGTP